MVGDLQGTPITALLSSLRETNGASVPKCTLARTHYSPEPMAPAGGGWRKEEGMFPLGLVDMMEDNSSGNRVEQ